MFPHLYFQPQCDHRELVRIHSVELAGGKLFSSECSRTIHELQRCKWRQLPTAPFQPVLQRGQRRQGPGRRYERAASGDLRGILNLLSLERSRPAPDARVYSCRAAIVSFCQQVGLPRTGSKKQGISQLACASRVRSTRATENLVADRVIPSRGNRLR